MADVDLARKYIEFCDSADDNATVDDFFDYCNISKKVRSDFAYSIIVKNAKKILDREKKETV